jgi:hypothetical protein
MFIKLLACLLHMFLNWRVSLFFIFSIIFYITLEFNPCGFSNMNNNQCICLPSSSLNAECGCQDQYEYDSNERICLRMS